MELVRSLMCSKAHAVRARGPRAAPGLYSGSHHKNSSPSFRNSYRRFTWAGSFQCLPTFRNFPATFIRPSNRHRRGKRLFKTAFKTQEGHKNNQKHIASLVITFSRTAECKMSIFYEAGIIGWSNLSAGLPEKCREIWKWRLGTSEPTHQSSHFLP